MGSILWHNACARPKSCSSVALSSAAIFSRVAVRKLSNTSWTAARSPPSISSRAANPTPSFAEEDSAFPEPTAPNSRERADMETGLQR